MVHVMTSTAGLTMAETIATPELPLTIGTTGGLEAVAGAAKDCQSFSTEALVACSGCLDAPGVLYAGGCAASPGVAPIWAYRP